MTDSPAIGFVGLGAMGFGMASQLVKQGYPVHGFDVFPASVERFKQSGGIPATSLHDSAKDKQFYVCMVATAPQAQEVLFGKDGIVQGKTVFFFLFVFFFFFFGVPKD